jgi:putative endonuclease
MSNDSICSVGNLNNVSCDLIDNLNPQSTHFVYILKCKDDTLYTGYTNDIKRRVRTHTEGKGAKYTRGRGPFQLVYVEEWDDKIKAMRREVEIKKLTRAEKVAMIEKGGQKPWVGTS